METVADRGNGKAADVQVGDIVRGTTARSKVVPTPFLKPILMCTNAADQTTLAE